MLKLKMWHQSWLSQFCKSLTFLLLLISMGKAVAQTPSSTQPGVIESLELLVDLHKKQYKLLLSKVRRNPKVLSNLAGLKNISLHPFFIRSLIFHSDEKYLDLAKKDKCKFYSLLENDLLKTAEGRISNVVVNFKTSEGKTESAILTRSDFINQIYKSECTTRKEYSTLFADENLKNTLGKIDFPTPTDKKDCENILEDWEKNPFTPYLCKIPEHVNLGKRAKRKLSNTDNTNFSKRRSLVELIRRAEFYNERVPYFERSYLNNLCNGLSNVDKFCRPYISDDVWSKVISGEYPDYLLRSKCQTALGKTKITKNQLLSCASKFKSEPKYCVSKGRKGMKSFSPAPNCESISDALVVSQLETDYHDCPGFVDNEGMINVHRIVSHLDGVKLNSTPATCVNEVNKTFASLMFDYDYEEGWPLRLCYRDKIDDKEVCLPYIPGDNQDDKMSEGNVVATILNKTRGLPSNLKCQVIDKRKYNPNFLEYKSGCYITYDPSQCTIQYCPKKILYNLRRVKEIKYVGKAEFDYFPTNFKKEKFSLANIMKEVFKLKEYKIRNFTDLIYFLDRKGSNIVHGIGCAEDLAPANFQKSGLNQCHPLPFIIDGYIKSGGQVNMVTRLAIDDIHSPRLIPWNFVFNSVASYKTLHPLDTWTLYGIQERNDAK